MSDDKTEEIKKNILSTSQWTRILFMVFYAVACWVLSIALSFIIVAQILISLISGKDNENLRSLGHKLADYFNDALKFLVYASNDKPWPFDDVEDVAEDDAESAVHTEPANDPDPAPAPEANVTAEDSTAPSDDGGDDVFADISFTDSADDGNDVESGGSHDSQLAGDEDNVQPEPEKPEEEPDKDRPDEDKPGH